MKARLPKGYGLSLIHISTLAQDVANLRFKQEAGATHLLTQLFFCLLYTSRRCRATAAGAVLKPQGGNCAVLPLMKIERERGFTSGRFHATIYLML